MIQIFTFIIAIIFALCVAILVAIAKLFGISYVESSVIVNLCIQPALLVISSFALFICRIKKRSGIIASFCYLVLNALAMVVVFIHYKVWNVNYAFEKCVYELNLLSDKITWLFPKNDLSLHESIDLSRDAPYEYMLVNVIIFVFLYLFVLYLNRKLAKI